MTRKHDKVIIYVRGQTLKYLKSGGKCFKIKKVTLTYYTPTVVFKRPASLETTTADNRDEKWSLR